MSNLMQDYSSYNEEQNLKLTVDNDLDIEETKELNDIDDITMLMIMEINMIQLVKN